MKTWQPSNANDGSYEYIHIGSFQLDLLVFVSIHNYYKGHVGDGLNFVRLLYNVSGNCECMSACRIHIFACPTQMFVG